MSSMNTVVNLRDVDLPIARRMNFPCFRSFSKKIFVASAELGCAT